MALLVINNSYSTIKGLTIAEEKKLREALSYVVGGNSAYFSGYGVKRRSLLSKRGDFPTGLLSRVLKIIETVEILDKRIKPSIRPHLSYNAKPYDSQYEAVDKAIKANRGIISMPTGSGKSLVIALLAARLNVSTLVVVPSLEIKKQLITSLIDVLGDISRIDVENVDSKNLKNNKHYDCLIIDEAHHSAAKTYQKLNKTRWTDIYYRFFLTATPFRNDDEETLLFESIAGNIVYKLTYKEAVTKGFIVPIESYYIELPKQKTDAYTWSQVYKELVVNNDIRNNIIVKLLNLLNINAVRTLCLVKEIEHGKLLALKMNEVAFVYGEGEGSTFFIKRFNEGKDKILIGTTGILGEGVDTKPAEFIIIAGLGKAKSQFMQQVGRGVRRYPGKQSAKIILIKDRSNKFTLRHFNEQKKILLEEYGVVPIRLEVEDV